MSAVMQLAFDDVALGDLPERVVAKITINPGTGCWEWTASRDHRGYGRLAVDRRARPAHRVTYERLVGPIPEGLQLDHLCRVRHCVNPDHLEPVTNRENALRGRSPVILAHLADVCVSGRHPLTGDNVRIRPGGGRQCKACIRAARSRRREAA